MLVSLCLRGEEHRLIVLLNVRLQISAVSNRERLLGQLDLFRCIKGNPILLIRQHGLANGTPFDESIVSTQYKRNETLEVQTPSAQITELIIDWTSDGSRH